jgi:alkyldihydroxyacetonephosphate synthase
LRNELLRRGVLVETLETVVSWNKFEKFHEKMINNLYKMVEELCGKGVVTCRITHCYPDGLAPYYTIIGQMDDVKKGVEKWDVIKNIANKTLVEMGASITHHHSVGRDHREGFKALTGDKILTILRKIKEVLDPKGIMNPEILL